MNSVAGGVRSLTANALMELKRSRLMFVDVEPAERRQSQSTRRHDE